MIASPFVFVHGWGFDAGFWDPLRAALAPHRGIALDLGYFGAAVSTLSSEPVIAVTHSFGTMVLLRDPQPNLAALIIINGFPRFTEAEDYKPATPSRVVSRMRRRFEDSAPEVLNEFRRRCGAEPIGAQSLDTARLADDLAAMESLDCRLALRAISALILVLSAEDDPIVPPAMAEQAFCTAPGITIRHAATGGHILPLSKPVWCAEMIREFLTP